MYKVVKNLFFGLAILSLSFLLAYWFFAYLLCCPIPYPFFIVADAKCETNAKEVILTLITENNISIPCKQLSIFKVSSRDLVKEKLSYLVHYNCSQQNFYEGTVFLYNEGACFEHTCDYIIELGGQHKFIKIEC